jgi:hypothetical protein
MQLPLVHVLVITWNGRAHLQACFEALLESTYANVRFVLIDNASTDDSVAFVRDTFGQDERVSIITCEKNLGWSRGNNVGMEAALEAGADYIFLLNDDTAIAPDAIERLVDAAEIQTSVGALAPKMVMFDTPDVLNSVGMECSIIGSCWDRGLGRLDTGRWDEPMDVIGACGGAAFFRTAALRETGLLPTDFDIYLDDLDLCFRIWNAGHTIRTCPAAVVRHKFSATMGTGDRARRKYYLNTRNRFRVLQRHVPWSKGLQVDAMCLLGEAKALGRGALDGDWWKFSAHARAWGAALTYLPTALADRRSLTQLGDGRCKFWHLIRSEPLFFPGAELPESGWYTPREWEGYPVRPISRRAHMDVREGRLRVFHANCYPELGSTDITILQDDRELAHLATDGFAEFDVEVSAGRLTIVANQIFEAEQTGESIDIGGWIEATPV